MPSRLMLKYRPSPLILPVVLLPVMLSAGCAHQREPVIPVSLIELGPARVLEMAAERAGEPFPMQMTGTLQMGYQGGSLTGRGVILFAEPDSVRLDVTAFLGTTVLQTVLTGRSAQIYSPTEKIVLEGTFDDQSMISIAGFPFHLSMVREWVLGPALAREWWRLADGVDRFDLGVREIILGTTELDGSRLLITLDTELIYRTVEYYNSGGRLIWESEYEDYQRVRGTWLPGTVTLRYPDNELEITYTVERRRADPDRAPGDFMLNLPSDVTRYTLRPDTVPPPRP
jgi:hypothetical protein